VKATVPQATIQQAGIHSMSVGQVGIGPIHIGQLLITDLKLGMSSGQAQLRNLRVTIGLSISLDWWVGVHIPLDGDVGGSGTIDLGSPSITVPLGNVMVPGLQSFTIDIASVSVDNLTAASSPIANLQLGTAIAEQIQARNAVIPAQGFSLAGLAIGSATATDLQVPAAGVDQVTIGRLHGEVFPLGQLALSNLGLPASGVGDIASGAVNVSATGTEYDAEADAGILRVTLRVTPHATARMDQLHLSGIQASGSVGRIELNNVVAPYELLNLTLSQVGIQTITVPTLGVS
jgi:hypothetical protein